MKMIKTASLFKWQHTNGKSSATPNGQAVMTGGGGGDGKQRNQKLWIHPPASLQNGHLAYLVKYFGNVEVNQPKGIEIVKESINKLKLLQPLKSQQNGTNKVPKVEITISVNGVAIQEPKTKKIFCQFPLHRISYCADDKAEKKFFSFIAKDADTGKQLCFVFMSEKMSEEIILTIGQAFDLAYAKFIENSGKELEIRKQLILLQKKVHDLEDENRQLRARIEKYEPEEKNTSAKGMDQEKAKTISTVPVPALQPPPMPLKKNTNINNNNEPINLLDCDMELDDKTQTILNQKSNSIHDLLDQEFDPRAADADILSPMTVANGNSSDDLSSSGITQEKDIFGCEPFKQDSAALVADNGTNNGTTVVDPFGMSTFDNGTSNRDLDSAMVSLDKKFAEMRDGFSQGLSAGGFNMDA